MEEWVVGCGSAAPRSITTFLLGQARNRVEDGWRANPMKRIPEPELMDSDEQARAYAAADFSEAHQSYVTLFHETFPERPATATALDLGCGAADVVIRFAEANPRYKFHAVDGSAAMLKYARKALRKHPDLARRIKLARALIPEARLPRKIYDVILSSNFLHHLHEPAALWQTIRRYAKHGTIVFVTDLFRPPNGAAAKRLVERYAAAEPAILRRDFLNSLLASFTVEEVREQLIQAQFGHLRVEKISDRHMMVSGLIGHVARHDSKPVRIFASSSSFPMKTIRLCRFSSGLQNRSGVASNIICTP